MHITSRIQQINNSVVSNAIFLPYYVLVEKIFTMIYFCIDMHHNMNDILHYFSYFLFYYFIIDYAWCFSEMSKLTLYHLLRQALFEYIFSSIIYDNLMYAVCTYIDISMIVQTIFNRYSFQKEKLLIAYLNVFRKKL